MAKIKPGKARKKPRQDRSRHLVETLLEAATRLLVQDDWEALSTNRVAERAGVSVGSLYQYFPNKEALLGELAQRHLQKMGDQIQLALGDIADLPLVEGVRRVLEVIFATVGRNPLLWRRLLLKAAAIGVDNARRAYEERCKQLIKAHLRSKRSELRSELDEELAAWFVVHQSIALIERYLTDPVAATSAQLVGEMTFAVTTYLSSAPSRTKVSSRRP